jgi:hypothetical protein
MYGYFYPGKPMPIAFVVQRDPSIDPVEAFLEFYYLPQASHITNQFAYSLARLSSCFLSFVVSECLIFHHFLFLIGCF